VECHDGRPGSENFECFAAPIISPRLMGVGKLRTNLNELVSESLFLAHLASFVHTQSALINSSDVPSFSLSLTHVDTARSLQSSSLQQESNHAF